MTQTARPDPIKRQFNSNHERIAGMLLNFGSAWAFYFATFCVRSAADIRPIDPALFAFIRYALGFGCFFLWYIGSPPAAGTRRFRLPPRFVVLRAVFNVGAVSAFYFAVARGYAGQANVLNMTYPAFVILFAGPLLGEHPDRKLLLVLGLAVIGISLNLVDSFAGVGSNPIAALSALASGILAALAIISLRGAALVADFREILVWMFGLGCVVLLPFGLSSFDTIGADILPALIGSAVLGVIGQWFLTLSYRFLSAAIGSVISATRIPIALVSGILLLGEPFALWAWLGAAIIFICNLLLAFQRITGQDADGARD